MCTGPRIRSFHSTIVWASLKRQCGLRPCCEIALQFVLAQLQRGAVIDGRKPPGLLAFAAAVQFVGRFIAGIEQPARPQVVGNGVIAGKALRLPFHPPDGVMPSQSMSTAMPLAYSSVERAVSVSS